MDILVGLLMISNTGLVATSLSIIMGFWILFNSIIQLANSLEFKKLGFSFWAYELISGIIGIVLSLIILANPSLGALTIAVVIGTYMVLFGIAEIYEYSLYRKIQK
ncbi:MAG: hypothetical protein GX638_03370 [Crenarchaeota archaeon]|nr:hypothetical protein [Thermoproteota archaeon]